MCNFSYTSSRTSLEPSEFGDESPQNHFQHNQHALNVDNIKENTQSSINLNKNDDEKLKLYKKKEFDNFSGQILIMSSPTTNRITLINQQLEDTFYDDNTNTKIVRAIFFKYYYMFILRMIIRVKKKIII